MRKLNPRCSLALSYQSQWAFYFEPPSKQYIKLNQQERFERAPVVRYINFVSDFLAAEKHATRAQAIQAWKRLKSLDCPKTYDAWKKHKRDKTP